MAGKQKATVEKKTEKSIVKEKPETIKVRFIIPIMGKRLYYRGQVYEIGREEAEKYKGDYTIVD